MTNKEAIYALKTRTCYECSYGCESPILCSCFDCDLKKSTILATEALERAEWISVSERLPENMNRVLIAKRIIDEDTVIDIGWYFAGEKTWYTNDFLVADVVAWMKLPKRYENEVEK